MLQIAVGLLEIALIAGLFGFGFIASSFMTVAQVVFYVFLVLAVASYFFGSRALKQWHG
jgi:uncharacterized membrane protein YtjA (UPF0391 family)